MEMSLGEKCLIELLTSKQEIVYMLASHMMVGFKSQWLPLIHLRNDATFLFLKSTCIIFGKLHPLQLFKHYGKFCYNLKCGGLTSVHKISVLGTCAKCFEDRASSCPIP